MIWILKEFENSISGISQKYFNSTELIENISSYQLFLNKEKIVSSGLE